MYEWVQPDPYLSMGGDGLGWLGGYLLLGQAKSQSRPFKSKPDPFVNWVENVNHTQLIKRELS